MGDVLDEYEKTLWAPDAKALSKMPITYCVGSFFVLLALAGMGGSAIELYAISAGRNA